ncbi:peptide-methionine (S)-S-oxide reductase MsrA [Rhizobium alarense]|uniref:peptide-methionine (S)-S-oxide reductase MsrA n=1 Tax=Rhizobium alarense TaxID=2846851 RepID=UPI0038B461E9
MMLHPGVAPAAEPQTALFAGGCFWCVESDFDRVPGVLDAVSGYAGGTSENPTYEDYSKNGHREVVQITFDPDKVTFAALADVLFRTTDPTDGGGQFCDRGFAYSPAIYALDAAQKAEAEAAKARAEAELGKATALAIEGSARFWPAEDYHQNFARRNPIRYFYYRTACGRDNAVEALWGDRAYAGVDH